MATNGNTEAYYDFIVYFDQKNSYYKSSCIETVLFEHNRFILPKTYETMLYLLT